MPLSPRPSGSKPLRVNSLDSVNSLVTSMPTTPLAHERPQRPSRLSSEDLACLDRLVASSSADRSASSGTLPPPARVGGFVLPEGVLPPRAGWQTPTFTLEAESSVLGPTPVPLNLRTLAPVWWAMCYVASHYTALQIDDRQLSAVTERILDHGFMPWGMPLLLRGPNHYLVCATQAQTYGSGELDDQSDKTGAQAAHKPQALRKQ